MKKICSLGLVLCSIFLFYSCQKVKDSIKTRIPLTMEFDIVIPPIDSPGVLYELNGYSSIDIDQMIQESNSKLNSKNIRSVKIQSMKIEIPPASQFPQDNFTAFELFQVSLSSNQNPEWLRIAESTNPTSPFLLNMNVNDDIDLNPYFDAHSFHYLFQIKAIRPTSEIISGTVSVKFIVEAGL